MSSQKPTEKNEPTIKRRVRKSISQEDLIGSFENTEATSKRSRGMLQTLKERDVAKHSEVHNEPIFSTASELDRVLLDYIQPQSDNPRFLPVSIPHSSDPDTIASLSDCVVCEKGTLENRLNKGHPRYAMVDAEVEKIIELSETLKHNDLIHPIVVWRANMSNYPIVSGHRRYYAIRYLYGGMVKVKTKIYLNKPKNVNVIRHIENFSRSELSSPDALLSYRNSVIELEQQIGTVEFNKEKFKIVPSYLGISRTNYYRYNKLNEHYNDVFPLLESGIVTSINSLCTEINHAESQGGQPAIKNYLEGLLEKNRFSKFIGVKTVKTAGPAKKFIFIPKVKVSRLPALKRLLCEDVTKLDIGIDWEQVDFEDPAQLEIVISKLLSAL